MTKEEKFYKALQDVFIGAKIEGTGGFVNLMRIKSNYYRRIEELLKKDIEVALKKYPDFRDELFDKLYTFFSRYFTESGSIYFNSTPFHNGVYEKIYTDDRDVILFWKTHMLYYVKTDRIFRSLGVESDGHKFFFDVSNLEHKKANEKRDLIYELKGVDENKTIILNVIYSERGRKTNTDDLLKKIRQQGVSITEEQLEKALKTFEKQSEVDYFINKNAKAFLQEQFKLWSYQYFWDGAKEWTVDRVNQLQILKDIAFKIIDFIAQFEDELIKIWNKPKFVKNSNYVITFDRLNNIELVEKILNHRNINEQVKEWKELKIVDDSFKIEDIVVTNLTGKYLSERYKYLPIDTKYFKELETEMLSQFEDIDKALDGWLIKSENYQALNTILPKFKEKVQTIYIDPPFNKEQDADYLYNVKYKDATWATILKDRLTLARELLKDTGSIFVRCDYNGNWIVRPLLDEIFRKENFRNEIDVKRTRTLKGEQKKFHTSNDTIYLYAKNVDLMNFNGYRKLKEKPKWVRMHLPGTVKGDGSRIVFGKKIYPPSGRKWVLDQEGFDRAIKEGLIKWDDELNEPLFLSKYETIGSDWTDIPSYTFDWDFPTENSEILLKRVIESTSTEGDLVLDFFLGSGTTTAVAHKLGRKWIGIEMDEHFHTVVLPRMKKVLAYDKSGISKENDVKEKYNKDKAGGFFKYYELEQYEEALANTVYENGDVIIVGNKSPYEQYIFLKDEKMLRALEIDYENNEVKVDLSKIYPNIDIAETLSNLLGKWIKRITPDFVEFEDGQRIEYDNLDYKIIKPLIWWE